MKIGDIFRDDIHRHIEEVIKVDALDDAVLIDEIKEYHPTPSIQQQMLKVLAAYDSVRQGPTSDIGVWVSGFFGAGKSSFAKLVGVLLESRKIGAQDSVDLFSGRITNDEIKVLLKQIREHIPTHVVIFDILKDNIAGAKEHPVTTVMYKALLRSLGYAIDLDLAELEIELEQRKELDAFKSKYSAVFAGRDWDKAKLLPMSAISEASRIRHELDPATYNAADSWARSRAKAEVSARKLAERAVSLSAKRAGGRNVVFVVDEIGQYTARDLSRIGDLQGVVESFSLVGKGKVWLIATSQEKLEAVVDIWEKDKSDLVRLKDRFKLPVDIKSTDIREVASHRVLAKNARGEQQLRQLYHQNSARLRAATHVTATVPLPSLDEDSFVALYPLLPYQVDLLIDMISGLRRQGTGPQTMGGSNRTIVSQSQQLVIHPKVGLVHEEVGMLVTFDSVYELVATNIATEIQQEVDEIEKGLGEMPGRVAKALVLLQFAERAHPSEENLAAVLHPAVHALSVLPQVREAVEKLILARKIRRTEHGLKIQSAAERTWDEERDGRQPSPGDRNRIVKEVIENLWGKGKTQQPSVQLGSTGRFTGGLRIGSESLVDGNVVFEVRLLDPSRPADEQILEARALTQRPDQDALVTWTAELSGNAEDAIRERYRSERMQQRGARTKEEEGLLREEGQRLRDANTTLRQEVERTLCHGRIFFGGKDRSPGDEASDPKVEARRVLGPALERIFHRFGDGDVKVATKDVEAILKSESLAGLPDCYSDLKIVQTIDGQPRLVTDRGAAKEILDWIRLRCDGGQAPSGKEAEQHFNAAPYGWGLELVQLVVATLLREGQVTITSGGQQLKQALTPEAKKAITSNMAFRALTVRIRESTLDNKKRVAAGKALEQEFGVQCPALTTESIASTLRERLGGEIPLLEQARDLLRDLRLPGGGAIEQGLNILRGINSGDDEDAIQSFLESADTLKNAIARGRGIEQNVTEPARVGLERARTADQQVGPVLEREIEASDPARQALVVLHDHLERETFYEHIPAIENSAALVLTRFKELYSEAFAARRQAYASALETLSGTSGWSALKEVEQFEVAQRLRERSTAAPLDEPWRQAATILTSLRDQADAAKTLLDAALDELRKLVTPEAVRIDISALFSEPIVADTLEAALAAIRAEIEKALADGRPVVLV
jgi:hypothetical protein